MRRNSVFFISSSYSLTTVLLLLLLLNYCTRTANVCLGAIYIKSKQQQVGTLGCLACVCGCGAVGTVVSSYPYCLARGFALLLDLGPRQFDKHKKKTKGFCFCLSVFYVGFSIRDPWLVGRQLPEPKIKTKTPNKKRRKKSI